MRNISIALLALVSLSIFSGCTKISGNSLYSGVSKSIIQSSLQTLHIPPTLPQPTLAAGFSHSCAILSGSLKCWGSNGTGELGNNSTVPSSAAVQVSGFESGSGVTSVAAGGQQTCAIKNGALYCWGNTPLGQNNIPTLIQGFESDVTAIWMGYGHQCAIKLGALYCWGLNDKGQLGDRSNTTRLSPVPVSGMNSEVIGIGGGTFHTCAIKSTGALYCWGYNNKGQLGNNSITNLNAPNLVPGLGAGVSVLSTGVATLGATCALKISGEFFCWGDNSKGQFGKATPTSSTSPVLITSTGSTVSSVASSLDFQCALAGDKVFCSGANAFGQLGKGGGADSAIPISPVGLTTGVTALASGYQHACAIQNGAPFCWGGNDSGQAGGSLVAIAQSTTPLSVGISAAKVMSSTYANHICSIGTTGAMNCWGQGDYGQIGNGLSTSINPKPIQIYSSGITSVSLGTYHTCASGTDVRCWGNNDYGQLGNGTISLGTSTTAPTTSGSGILPSVSALSSGTIFNCAIQSGNLKCWGYNGQGQLGNGTSGTSTTTPGNALAGLGTTVATVSNGSDFACAINSTGALYCWGSNNYGQLGNGTGGSITTAPGAAIPPINSTTFTSVSAGADHACTINSAGALYCWGNNSQGQLGLGNSGNPTSAPSSAVSGISGTVTAVATGYGQTCAINSIGALYCWGYNNRGQLGAGGTSTSSTNKPTSPVLGMSSGVTSVALGLYFTCAVQNGFVKCWGSNDSGQLGQDHSILQIPMSVTF